MHAPISTVDIDDVDDFYQQVKDAFDDLPKKDTIIVMVTNAK